MAFWWPVNDGERERERERERKGGREKLIAD